MKTPLIKNNKILLVEDEPVNQMVITMMINRAGYLCDLAKNGSEALKLATTNLYKLVLMDIELPDMNGIDVTYKIRKNGKPQRHVPIVALTSHTEEDIKDKCRKSGMNGFANKPIKQNDLCLLIHQYAQ